MSIDLLSIFADDKKMITYRPEWRKFTGSVTSTILLGQVLYWWTRNGRMPFYKFKQPCNHRYYRAGDSWTEELGFTRHEFNSALNKIGIKITADNKGEEHGQLIEYWTDMNRVTFYTINAANLERVLCRNYNNKAVKPESGFTKSTNPALHIKPESGFTKSRNPALVPYTETTNKKKTTTTTDHPTHPDAVVVASLLNLIPKDRQGGIEPVIRQKLQKYKGDQDRIRDNIRYALANSNGNLRGFLGRSIDENWGAGWEPEPPKPAAQPKKKEPVPDIQRLHTAYEILLTQGQTAFDRYCDKVNISDADRDSVLFKFERSDRSRSLTFKEG